MGTKDTMTNTESEKIDSSKPDTETTIHNNPPRQTIQNQGPVRSGGDVSLIRKNQNWAGRLED